MRVSREWHSRLRHTRAEGECITKPSAIRVHHCIKTRSQLSEGVPVAWAISSKEDLDALSAVLQQLKLRTGDLKPQHFMSDDTQQYWNAWAAAYSSNNTTKLLCTWHIDRAWRKDLHEHVPNNEQKALVYHQLRVLLSETEEAKFDVLLQQFLSYAVANHQRFFQYFRDHYARRCGQWASCHRVGTMVNTNMHMKSFHRLLKVVYVP